MGIRIDPDDPVIQKKLSKLRMNPYPSAYSPYSTDPLHKSVVDIALPTSFRRKKSKILADLSVSTSEYDDLSPKGSVDDSIRDLIDEINGQHGFVTTSSCGGRISVFLEGIKKDNIGKRVERRDEDEESENENGSRDRQATLAAVGGKGGGGRWLFVSHDPICIDGQAEGDLRRIFGMDDPENKEKVFGEGTNREQLVHFKFEPMVSVVYVTPRQFTNFLLDLAHTHSIVGSRSSSTHSRFQCRFSRIRRSQFIPLYNRIRNNTHTCSGGSNHGTWVRIHYWVS